MKETKRGEGGRKKEEERNAACVWRIKKNGIIIFSQYFYNKFEMVRYY